MQTRKQNNAAILAAGHEKNFAPAKVIKKNYKPPYEHLTDRRDVVKNYRDEEGAVITAPRNFLTNPCKQGRVGKQTTFGGVIPFMGDDYFAGKTAATKERLFHESKLQDKPFSQ